MNRKELREYIDLVVATKGYDERLANMLQISVPIIIQFYGEEYADVVAGVLKYTRIERITDERTIFDVIKATEEKGVHSESAKEDDDNAKIANGAHTVVPILKRNENGDFELVGTESVVAFFDKNNSDRLAMATLIHELGHAIKSHNHKHELQKSEDGKLYIKSESGLIKTLNEVVVDESGNPILRKIFKKNVGFEEGINTCDEVDIMNLIIIQDTSLLTSNERSLVDSIGTEIYDSSGYRLVRILSRNLLKTYSHEIKETQLGGGDEFFEQFDRRAIERGMPTFEMISRDLDRFIELDYDRLKNVFNLKAWDEEYFEEYKQLLNGTNEMIIETSKHKQPIKNLDNSAER